MVFLVLGFFIVTRINLDQVGEPRWYFPLLLGSMICISRATVSIADYVGKHNKPIAAIIIILLIGYGGYYELQHADQIIKGKISSFEGVKQASLYLRDNSAKTDIVVTVPKPQVTYYSERVATTPAVTLDDKLEKETTFEEFLTKVGSDENIKYIIITFSEPNHPTWMRSEEYVQDPQTGQVMYSKWNIPFMESSIDFATGQQNLQQFKQYENIEFELINIFQDAFLYKINRK